MAELHTGRHPELHYLFTVPNEGFRHKAMAVAMQRQGVKKGVPDLIFPVRRGG